MSKGILHIAQSSNALLPDHASLLYALGGYGLARRVRPKAPRKRPGLVHLEWDAEGVWE